MTDKQDINLTSEVIKSLAISIFSEMSSYNNVKKSDNQVKNRKKVNNNENCRY